MRMRVDMVEKAPIEEIHFAKNRGGQQPSREMFQWESVPEEDLLRWQAIARSGMTHSSYRLLPIGFSLYACPNGGSEVCGIMMGTFLLQGYLHETERLF